MGEAVEFLGPADDVVTRGIILGVSVEVLICDRPVEVTVTAAGTAEYWEENKASIPYGRGRFAFVISDPSIRRVSVEEGSELNSMDSSLPLPGLGSDGGESPIEYVVRRNDEAIAIAGSVSRWRQTWEPLAIRFVADWLVPRSDGTCYVRLPALTGAGASPSIAAAGSRTSNGHRNRRILAFDDLEAFSRGATLLAQTSVLAYGGQVDPASSRPQPSFNTNQAAIWSCEERFPTVPSLAIAAPRSRRLEKGIAFSSSGEGIAFSEESYRRRSFVATGCDAIAVVEESGASSRRDLGLLVFGSAIGLGLALTVQGLLGVLDLALAGWGRDY